MPSKGKIAIPMPTDALK